MFTVCVLTFISLTLLFIVNLIKYYQNPTKYEDKKYKHGEVTIIKRGESFFGQTFGTVLCCVYFISILGMFVDWTKYGL